MFFEYSKNLKVNHKLYKYIQFCIFRVLVHHIFIILDYAWMLGICNKLEVIAFCTFFASFKSSFYGLTASVVSTIHLSHKILYLIRFINFTFLCPNPSTITTLTTISSLPSLSNSTMTGLSITIIFPRDIRFSWAAKLQQA